MEYRLYQSRSNKGTKIAFDSLVALCIFVPRLTSLQPEDGSVHRGFMATRR